MQNARCELCAWPVNEACDCEQNPYYRYWCPLIVAQCCEFYSRRPEPLPVIGGGLETQEENNHG